MDHPLSRTSTRIEGGEEDLCSDGIKLTAPTSWASELQTVSQWLYAGFLPGGPFVLLGIFSLVIPLSRGCPRGAAVGGGIVAVIPLAFCGPIQFLLGPAMPKFAHAALLGRQ